MKTFKEISNTRDYKYHSMLKTIFIDDNKFEDAIEDNIKNLKDKITFSITKYDELCEKTNEKEYSTLTPEDFELIDEECFHEGNIELFSQHLRSLNEMRIIYLFKNLELNIKSIIKYAYPDVNTKEFYRWQILITFLLEKNIIVNTIVGYEEVFQLKEVNNTLKHADSFQQKLSKIPEFINGFSNTSLEQFTLRVRPKVESFLEHLSVAVADERFSFDDERIDKIVDEYFYRMDKSSFEILIEKLKLKNALAIPLQNKKGAAF